MKYFLSIMTFIFYLALVSPSWAVHYPPTLNNEGSRTFVVGAVDRMGVISQYGFTFTYVMAGLGALALVIMGFFGRFSWKTSAMILGGLAFLAGFQAIIQFLS